MSETKEKHNRDPQPPVPLSSDGPGPTPGFFNRIPSRIWFPIGFVGFFFIVGGWNQIRATWNALTGLPVPASGDGLGLVAGALVFTVCTACGLRAWWRERVARNLAARSRSHWREDLKKHQDDIRFP